VTLGLALALVLGLPLTLAPGLLLGPQPYNPFVFGLGPKARVATPRSTRLLGKWTRPGVSSCFNHMG